MQVVTEEQAIAALGRIRTGATLTAERKKLGLGSSQSLRAALIALLGSRAMYSDLMAGRRQTRSGSGARGPAAGGDDDGMIDL